MKIDFTTGKVYYPDEAEELKESLEEMKITENMGIETGDTLATVYCPYCDAKREVNRGKEDREAFCQCGNQMFYKNEYLHEKGRNRTIGKEKLPEIEQVPF